MRSVDNFGGTKSGAQILMKWLKNKGSIWQNRVNAFRCYFRTNVLSFHPFIAAYFIHFLTFDFSYMHHGLFFLLLLSSFLKNKAYHGINWVKSIKLIMQSILKYSYHHLLRCQGTCRNRKSFLINIFPHVIKQHSKGF